MLLIIILFLRISIAERVQFTIYRPQKPFYSIVYNRYKQLRLNGRMYIEQLQKDFLAEQKTVPLVGL